MWTITRASYEDEKSKTEHDKRKMFADARKSIDYKRVSVPAGPIFVCKSHFGVTATMGVTDRLFSLGYCTVTSTIASADGLYFLEFKTESPLDSRFAYSSDEWFVPETDFVTPVSP